MSSLKAAVSAIEYYLPAATLDNDSLAALSDRWTAEKIHGKTGIRQRHVAAAEEYASDLAVHAAEKLFTVHAIDRLSIDALLLCTQSPDYLLPTTACLVQDRLGLRQEIAALDFNLGCSGYVYGLGLAKGLLETGQAQRVLLITSETYSKFIHEPDLNVRTLFGDAAAATLCEVSGDEVSIGPFVYGTDGQGASNLIVEGSALRGTAQAQPMRLHMNGPEIFSFTLDAVPTVITQLLQRAQVDLEQIDFFVFHQANKYMLDHLRDKIGILPERFCFAMENYGNTVSSTIPIALADLRDSGRLDAGAQLMLVGFGVGYSWGATLLRWTVSKKNVAPG